MESSEFVSIESIYSRIITSVGDDNLGRFDRGYYISKIHDAVRFFALETFYQTVVKDIFNYDVNHNGVIDLPANAFNVREMYLFNDAATCTQHTGQCACTQRTAITNYAYVHWKRNLAYGDSGLKSMKIQEDNTDPVFSTSPYIGLNVRKRTDVIYGNIQQGKIVIVDNQDFKHLRIIYNGMGAESCELPTIPVIIQDGIFEKARLEVLFDLKMRDKQYRTDYIDAYNAFYGTGREKGTFARCSYRMKSMDKFKKDAMFEYFGNADII